MGFADKRKDDRYRFNSEIIVNDNLFATAGDISLGGIYIKSSATMKMGETVTVTIPDYGLTVKAVVKYRKPGDGVGIHFEDLTREQKARINEIIQNLEAQAEGMAVKPVVLVADNSKRLRTQMKRRLVAEGFSVVEAEDGLDVIKKMNMHFCHAVLMDLDMRRMDGFEVLRLIRESPDHKDQLVIVMSDLAGFSTMDQAMTAGADHFVTKSDHMLDELLQRLTALLGTERIVEGEDEEEDPFKHLI
ncbi:MAG: response regulator [Thermodesulfovibrionales bacterium]|nr:response regulator [Thermodesulfovibrionales bacterium]